MLLPPHTHTQPPTNHQGEDRKPQLLGLQISENLSRAKNTATTMKRVQQRLHFMLTKAGLKKERVTGSDLPTMDNIYTQRSARGKHRGFSGTTPSRSYSVSVEGLRPQPETPQVGEHRCPQGSPPKLFISATVCHCQTSVMEH